MPPEPSAEHVESAVADRGGAVIIAPVGGARRRWPARPRTARRDSVWVTGFGVRRGGGPVCRVRGLIEVPDAGQDRLGTSRGPGITRRTLLVVDDAHLLDYAVRCACLPVGGRRYGADDGHRHHRQSADGAPEIAALWRDGPLLKRINPWLPRATTTAG